MRRASRHFTRTLAQASRLRAKRVASVRSESPTREASRPRGKRVGPDPLMSRETSLRMKGKILSNIGARPSETSMLLTVSFPRSAARMLTHVRASAFLSLGPKSLGNFTYARKPTCCREEALRGVGPSRSRRLGRSKKRVAFRDGEGLARGRRVSASAGRSRRRRRRAGGPRATSARQAWVARRLLREEQGDAMSERQWPS